MTSDVPQFQDPYTPSPSEIQANTVTLPQGFSINPNAADGKVACSDAKRGCEHQEAGQCPEFAKVGTLELDSSALPAPISGYIYLGEPKPGDRYRLFLTANGFGDRGEAARARSTPTPQTGQLVVSFEDLPQTPFQEFDLHFFGSERGLLATPTQCGTYPVEAHVHAVGRRSLSDQTSTQFFALDSGPNGSPCPNGPRPFAPGFEAGVEDNTAGGTQPFALRSDAATTGTRTSPAQGHRRPRVPRDPRGHPLLPGGGHSTSSASPDYTGLAERPRPACPAASQVGTASTGAGAGTHPLYTPGKVYLAGPYKGAPLSLVVVVPAVAGPYDLGNVVVRAAVDVDPTTRR